MMIYAAVSRRMVRCRNQKALSVGLFSARLLPLFSGRCSEAALVFARPIVLGYSYEEIAEQRGCSVQMIKNTLARIFDKLGISSRLELRNMLTL